MYNPVAVVPDTSVRQPAGRIQTRIGILYLWLGLPLMLVSRIVLPRGGYLGLLLIGLVHLALLAAVATHLNTRSRVARGTGATGTAGLLLLLGPAIFVLGAASGAPGPANPASYAWNTMGLFLGSIVTLAGFVALAVAVWTRGELVPAALGLAGALLATTLWLPSLALRIAVLATGSGDVWAALDEVYAHFRASNAPVAQFADSWRVFLLLVAYVLSTVHKVFVFLICAHFASTLRRVDLIGVAAARTLGVLGLALAAVVLFGRLLFAVPAVRVAWMVATMPFGAYVLAYALGVTLIAYASWGVRHVPEPERSRANGHADASGPANGLARSSRRWRRAIGVPTVHI